MYKKYIQYITRVPFSVIFLIFRCKGSVCLARSSFLKDWTGGSWRGPSVLQIFNWLRCILRCCHPLTSTAPCAGQNGTGVPSAPFTAIYPRQQQHTDICKLYATKWQTLPLFWNCVCKSYIFTCRLLLFCVLEICCIGFFLLLKDEKVKFSVCWKNVSHWKCSEVKSSEISFFYYFSILCLYLWGAFLRVRGRNQKSWKGYDINSPCLMTLHF